MKITKVCCNDCKQKFNLLNLQANLIGYIYICFKCSQIKKPKK